MITGHKRLIDNAATLFHIVSRGTIWIIETALKRFALLVGWIFLFQSAGKKLQNFVQLNVNMLLGKSRNILQSDVNNAEKILTPNLRSTTIIVRNCAIIILNATGLKRFVLFVTKNLKLKNRMLTLSAVQSNADISIKEQKQSACMEVVTGKKKEKIFCRLMGMCASFVADQKTLLFIIESLSERVVGLTMEIWLRYADRAIQNYITWLNMNKIKLGGYLNE